MALLSHTILGHAWYSGITAAIAPLAEGRLNHLDHMDHMDGIHHMASTRPFRKKSARLRGRIS